MSRNLYLLAPTLLLFSLVSCGMSLIPNTLQPGLPVNGSVWKTIGLVLLLLSLLSALAGILTAMFEAKKVPLSFLGLIPNYYNFHLTGFPSVVDTVAPDFALKEFDAYFAYVLDLVDRLKPVWYR